MKVLVTGGAGYIGSVVAWELIRQGDEVVVLDNLYMGHREAVPAGAAFVEGDLPTGAGGAGHAEHRPDAVCTCLPHARRRVNGRALPVSAR